MSQRRSIQTSELHQASFQTAKSAVLQALATTSPDRSMKGGIDGEIRPLLDEINGHQELYTTSSCAGRVQILGMMLAKEGKGKRPFWLYQNHSGIKGEILKELYTRLDGGALQSSVLTSGSGNVLEAISEDIKLEHPVIEGELSTPPDGTKRIFEIRLICQGPILHIATPSVDIGNELMAKLQHAGVKQTMIRSVRTMRTIISCTSSTNISALMWLREYGWLVNLSLEQLNQVLADEMTRTMLDSRERYFKAVRSVVQTFRQ